MTSQQPAPERVATQMVSAFSLARTTIQSVESAPMQAGSKIIAMMVLHHLGTGNYWNNQYSRINVQHSKFNTQNSNRRSKVEHPIPSFYDCCSDIGYFRLASRFRWDKVVASQNSRRILESESFQLSFSDGQRG